MNFDKSPILVFWETTKACRLACRHCRAEAIAEPLPTQLSHEEGLAFIDRLLGFAPYRPVLILTGGDPFMRSDLFELAAHAGQAGLPIGFAPSVTPLLDREAASRMLEVGPKTVSISLDGARPQTHEGIRGVDGHFERTLDAVRMLVDVGHTVQINTTVMRPNVEELADVAALVASLAAHIWEVFFLIKVGRGQELEELTPEENEDVVQFLFDASHYGFIVRTVEAPFFRRVVAWRQDDGTCTAGFGGPLYERLATGLVDRLGPARLATKAQSVGTRDGKGILFVSHDGYLYPSGFLPVPLGNVKRDDVVAVYRTHPLLRSIRRAEFTGRCGACEYADACGGSRARAFATSLNALGEDPACAYSPAPLDLVL